MGRGKEYEYVKGGKQAANAKVARRTQGQPGKSGSKSDERKHTESRTSDRGTGSEYAYAVGKALKDGERMRSKAKEGFLGVSNRTLDPMDRASDRVLYKGKKRG